MRFGVRPFQISPLPVNFPQVSDSHRVELQVSDARADLPDGATHIVYLNFLSRNGKIDPLLGE
jgi:hypothetical protein